VKAPQLEQRKLGRAGVSVSRLALGMMSYGSGAGWTLDESEAMPIVRAAVEAGITFFDTADMYGDGASEVVTGRLLAKLAKREDVVVATKVFYPTGTNANDGGLSRKHILSAIDASLRRLKMEYVDLYQVHRWDAETPIAETMEALNDVVRAGKARYIGASTMHAWQFAKAQHVAELRGWTRFASMQNRYNLLYREDEREMIPLCLDEGVAVLPYSPLAGGALAGTRSRDGTAHTRRAASISGDSLYGREGDFPVIDRVVEVAGECGCSAAVVALAWVLHKGAVVAPVVGATRERHIAEAVSATHLRLDAEQLRRLEELYAPRDWVG
jgi:1-deoxyxylulose-5-phosphate synthase